MNADQLVKVKDLLLKRGFEEMRMKPGIFTKDRIPNMRLVDLNKEPPQVCISNGVERFDEGHGVSEVDDIRREVLNLSRLDNKGERSGAGTVKKDDPAPLQSPSTEQKGSNPASGGINKAPELKKDDVMKGAIPSESKLGTGDIPVKIPMCRKCGVEVSHARALACLGNDEPCTCEDCGEKKERGYMSAERDETEGCKDAELVEPSKNIPAVQKKKNELQIGKCEAVAAQYGIPSEMANLFFMTMDGGLYIKNPGLLYLASKKGYSRIEVTTSFDDRTQEWSAECKIYPKLTKDILEGIARLDKDIQKIAFDFATQPTNGTGRASKANVRMSTMHTFLKEMAQTRAQNRTLRAFTGYGGCSYEEIPDAQLERD